MGLFFDVLSAINNPDQQANVEQLQNLATSVQQVASENNLDASTTQSVLSALGGALRPALQQQAQSTGGIDQLGGLLSQLTGGGNNPLGGILGQLTGGAGGMAALQNMIPQQLQDQIIQGVAQKTGLNASMIQGMLPTLLPAVMGMFQMGASKPGASGQGGNPLLNAFLDVDRDGDVDLGDMLKFANRFLGSK
jgi:hypothetical protein